MIAVLRDCGLEVAAIAVIAGLRCAESIKGVLRCVVLYLTLAALASGGGLALGDARSC